MTERQEKIYVVTPHMFPLNPVFCRRSDKPTEQQNDGEKLLEEQVSKGNPLVISFHQWLQESYLPVIMRYLHFIIQNPIQYLEVTKQLKRVIGISVDTIISHDTIMSSFLAAQLPNYLQDSQSPDMYSICAIPASSGMFFSIKDILTEKNQNYDFGLFLELIYEILKLRLHVTTFPTVWSTMRHRNENSSQETTRREDVENVASEKYNELKDKKGFEKFYDKMQRLDVSSALN